jgi:hypothetical protein
MGLSVIAIAKSRAQDDVLFRLTDGQVAEVHLTGRGSQGPDQRWPRTTIYPSIDAWAELRMRPVDEASTG